MDRTEFPVRHIRLACTSGDTSGIIVPANQICHIKSIEYDTAAISGNTSVVTISILDKYTPTGGSATTKVRKQFTVKTGEVGHIDTKGDINVLSRGDVRCSYSGPVISMGYALE